MLYDSKDLVTHAVCVGMTGSGKTGLCIALLEEAAIDGIPALVIDPKGDLANLLLTFPELRPRISCPGSTRTRRAARACPSRTTPPSRPTSGRTAWPPGARTARASQRFKDAADFAIYTPGSTAGMPVSILKSFAAPPSEHPRRQRAARRAHQHHRHQPADPDGHRRRPDAQPRAHPALDDPRRGLAATARTWTWPA